MMRKNVKLSKGVQRTYHMEKCGTVVPQSNFQFVTSYFHSYERIKVKFPHGCTPAYAPMRERELISVNDKGSRK